MCQGLVGGGRTWAFTLTGLGSHIRIWSTGGDMICLVQSKTVAYPFSGASSIQAGPFLPTMSPLPPWDPMDPSSLF